MKSLKGASNTKDFLGCSGNRTIAEPTESIFPIIKQDRSSKKFSVVGTGFFISWQGLIMTAKHVLKDAIKKRKVNDPIGICQFLPNNKYIIRHIVKGYWSEGSDVAVARLEVSTHKTTNEPLTNKTLKMSLEKCAQGDPVHTFAYPASYITVSKKMQEMSYIGAFYEGELQEEFPNGREKGMLPNPCWRCSIHIHGGASGGPVFNARGKVIGINSTSFINDPSCAFISTLSHIMNLKISDINVEGYKKNDFTLKELAEIGIVNFK